jgi:hypothetical protein
MALNSIIPVGDDQAWKSEVEREIFELKKQIAILASQINSSRGR